MTSPLRVKICGITQPDQGRAVAALGAHALGFICVPPSPRYVTAQQIRQIGDGLPADVDRVGVFMNADFEEMVETAQVAGLTSLQLHGNEDPEFCRELRSALPQIELIKAFRIRSGRDIAFIEAMTAPYADDVDWFLLDAYHPSQGGGTGQTLDWEAIPDFAPQRPWFLAGGLRPDNVGTALGQVQPQGIDLSSGVERSPGDKDLAAVQALFVALRDRAAADRRNPRKSPP
jgi:phosphoribosylanthranilate isomerase